jgi:hypothetical protein
MRVVPIIGFTHSEALGTSGSGKPSRCSAQLAHVKAKTIVAAKEGLNVRNMHAPSEFVSMLQI